MSKTSVKVSINYAGVGKLLKCSELEAGLEDVADGIAKRAGKGYESDTKKMSTRVVASVYTADCDAMRDNKKNNTLLKALK